MSKQRGRQKEEWQEKGTAIHFLILSNVSWEHLMCRTLLGAWDSEMSMKMPQLQKAQSLCEWRQEQAEVRGQGVDQE